MPTNDTTAMSRTRVVIIGGGFGGVAAAKHLAGCDAEVTLIDRRNYHLFQPLLYQVATADLSPAEVAWPIRSLFTRNPNVTTVLSEVTGIDRQARVVMAGGRRYSYDALVIATGADNFYFGHDDWKPFSPGLKGISDATEVRKRVLLAFELAEVADSSADQRRLLNFVVVGGGPTGVELAGAIAELARVTLVRDFRRINPRDARIVLVEAGERVLPGFAPELSDYARDCLQRLGVEIVLGSPVTAVNFDGIRQSGTFIPSATVVWAAGVKVNGPGTWLGIDTDRGGRIPVGPDLSVPGNRELFVIGDASRVAWSEDRIVPGLAPAAKQQGRYVAGVIRAKVEGREAPAPFRYRHAGSLATIGRNSAVADLGWLRLRGRAAWWFWGLIHIYFLINTRAATIVLLQWFWAYLTRKKGARLITGLRPPVVATTPTTRETSREGS